jgi:hypothetical protein
MTLITLLTFFRLPSVSFTPIRPSSEAGSLRVLDRGEGERLPHPDQARGLSTQGLVAGPQDPKGIAISAMTRDGTTDLARQWPQS